MISAFVLLSALTLAPQTAWEWQPQDSGTQASLRGLCAVDATTAWASGSGGTVRVTTDGTTWEDVSVPGAEDLDFRDVHAFDARRAVVLSAGAPTRAYRTEDGGSRWSLVYANDDERAFFDAMDFWDESRGLAFSDPVDGRLLVIQTRDGGKSWQTLNPGKLPVSPAGEAGFAASGTCLRVASGGRAWIGTGGIAGARVVYTADYGETWKVATTPMRSGLPSTGVFSVLGVEGTRVVAVGGDYADPEVAQGSLALSEDGGANWRAVTQGTTGFRSCIERISGEAGPTLVAVGTHGTDLSFDGGETWRFLSAEGYHVLSSTPTGEVWAAGSRGRIARLCKRGQENQADWCRYRGPNGTGIATGNGFPDRIDPETNVRWKRSFPAGHSSPILSRERLFLTGVEDERLMTYGLDRATGETLWAAQAPRPRRTRFHPKNHAASASAAVDHDTVAVFFDEYGLLAYDHDGNERFRLPLGPFDNVYGMGASPILVDDVIVLPCDQSSDSYVLAVTKQGRVLWKRSRPRAISGHCTPVIYAPEAGEIQVLLPGSYRLDAYDLLTGEVRWWVRGLPSEMKSVPVLLGETLYTHGYSAPINDLGNQIQIPGWEPALERMDADGDGRIGPTELEEETLRNWFGFYDLQADGTLDESEWAALRDNLAAVNSAMALRVGGDGDRTEEAVLWAYHRSIPQLPSPLIHGGIYYLLADQGGLITTLKADSGERLERGRLGRAVDAYYTSPVVAEERIYLLSETGILTVLPTGGSLEPLYTVEFGEPCYATPAFEDGQIWLRTDGTLYCFQGA